MGKKSAKKREPKDAASIPVVDEPKLKNVTNPKDKTKTKRKKKGEGQAREHLPTKAVFVDLSEKVEESADEEVEPKKKRRGRNPDPPGLIENYASRSMTYNKRTKGLMKLAEKLNKFTGAPTMVVIGEMHEAKQEHKHVLVTGCFLRFLSDPNLKKQLAELLQLSSNENYESDESMILENPPSGHNSSSGDER